MNNSEGKEETNWEQKVGELEFLLYQIEAVGAAIEPEVSGERGPPNQQAHGLQMTLMTLAARGLVITGAKAPD